MTSIFQNVSTRMYSISGELSDCFCLPNGWILGFEELLTLRMEQLGFDSVVFCSTQREMFYALNMAGAAALETLRAHGVTRVSVNPQTMSDRVLEAIGRRTGYDGL